MNWTLEVVPVPVSDVDAALAFYTDGAGFHLDHDVRPAPGVRFVQLTPPGSACSIVLGAASGMEPGTLRGLQLVVPDVLAARAELAARGVAVTEVSAIDGNEDALRQGGAALDNVGFCFFPDPDGNTWAVQQISARG